MQVSNYFVLQDIPFTLEGNQIKRFEVPTPDLFHKPTARPVLQFRMLPLSDHLKFIVLLNDFVGDPNNIPADKIVFPYDFDGSRHRILRGIHEVLDGNDFLPEGSTNIIDFRVVTGSVNIADVVLFFRIET
jgi:hypothetical protein